MLLGVEEAEGHHAQVDDQHDPEKGRAEGELVARDGKAHHPRDDGKPGADEIAPKANVHDAEEYPQHLHAQPGHVDGEAGHKAELLGGPEVLFHLGVLIQKCVQTDVGAAAHDVGHRQGHRRAQGVGQKSRPHGEDQGHGDDQRVIENDAGEPLGQIQRHDHREGQNGLFLHEFRDGVQGFEPSRRVNDLHP